MREFNVNALAMIQLIYKLNSNLNIIQGVSQKSILRKVKSNNEKTYRYPIYKTEVVYKTEVFRKPFISRYYIIARQIL